MFLTSNRCFQLKKDSSIHNIAFPIEKVIWIRREKGIDRALFMSENSPKQFYTNMFMDFAVRKQWGMDFVTEESFIIDYDLYWPKAMV